MLQKGQAQSLTLTVTYFWPRPSKEIAWTDIFKRLKRSWTLYMVYSSYCKYNWKLFSSRTPTKNPNQEYKNLTNPVTLSSPSHPIPLETIVEQVLWSLGGGRSGGWTWCISAWGWRREEPVNINITDFPHCFYYSLPPPRWKSWVCVVRQQRGREERYYCYHYSDGFRQRQLNSLRESFIRQSQWGITGDMSGDGWYLKIIFRFSWSLTRPN